MEINYYCMHNLQYWTKKVHKIYITKLLWIYCFCKNEFHIYSNLLSKKENHRDAFIFLIAFKVTLFYQLILPCVEINLKISKSLRSFQNRILKFNTTHSSIINDILNSDELFHRASNHVIHIYRKFYLMLKERKGNFKFRKIFSFWILNFCRGFQYQK